MRILVPVDGSAHADAALDFVASRSRLAGLDIDVRLLNVQPTLSGAIMRTIGRTDARAYQRAQADDVLRPALQRLRRAGVAAKAGFTAGPRADEIGAAAVRGRCDLIVMGSRGHSPLKGLVFGSMASAVLAGSTKPLLLLRSAIPPARANLRVGIAIDGSRHGQAAVRWVLKHRGLFGAEPLFQLIHVRDTSARQARRAAPATAPDTATGDTAALVMHSGIPVPDGVDVDRIVAPVLRLFSRAGLVPQIVGLSGDNPGDAIVAHARRSRLDLLAMGSHGRGAFESMVLGSVAMRVAARSDKPLLIIREK